MYLLILSDAHTETPQTCTTLCRRVPGLPATCLVCTGHEKFFDFFSFYSSLREVVDFAGGGLHTEHDLYIISTSALACHVMGCLLECLKERKEEESANKERQQLLSLLLSFHREVAQATYNSIRDNPAKAKKISVGGRLVVFRAVESSSKIRDALDVDAHLSQLYFTPKEPPPPAHCTYYSSLEEAPPFVALFFSEMVVPNGGGKILEISGPELETTTQQRRRRVVVRMLAPSSRLECYRVSVSGGEEGGFRRREKTVPASGFQVVAQPRGYIPLLHGTLLEVEYKEHLPRAKKEQHRYFNSGLPTLWRLQMQRGWRLGQDLREGETYPVATLLPLLKISTVIEGAYLTWLRGTTSSRKNMPTARGVFSVNWDKEGPPDIVLFAGSLSARHALMCSLSSLPPCLIIDLFEDGMKVHEDPEEYIARKNPAVLMLAIALECKFGSLHHHPLNPMKMVLGAYLHTAILLALPHQVLVPDVPTEHHKKGKKRRGKNENSASAAPTTTTTTTTAPDEPDHLFVPFAFEAPEGAGEGAGEEAGEEEEEAAEEEEESKKRKKNKKKRKENSASSVGGLIERKEEYVGFHGSEVIEVDHVSFYPNLCLTGDFSPDDLGVQSTLLSYLLRERAEEKLENPGSAREQALKLFANETYGWASRLDFELGCKITALGRKIMQVSRNAVEEASHLSVIYIATDSLFVKGSKTARSKKLASHIEQVVDLTHHKVGVKRIFSSLTLCARTNSFFGLIGGKLEHSSLECGRSDFPPAPKAWFEGFLTQVATFLPEQEDITDPSFANTFFEFCCELLHDERRVLETLVAKRAAETCASLVRVDTSAVWPPPDTIPYAGGQISAAHLLAKLALRRELHGDSLPLFIPVLPLLSEAHGDTWDTPAFLYENDRGYVLDEVKVWESCYVAPVAHIISSLYGTDQVKVKEAILHNVHKLAQK